MKSKSKHIPFRMCSGCRQMFPKKELIRIVQCDGNLLIDEEKKFLSRGIYLCKNDECIQKSKKRKALSGFLKNKVPDELYEELEKRVGK